MVARERTSDADSAGSEQGNCGDSHKCCRRPPEDLGRLAVYILAHQLPVARYKHDHHEKRRSNYPVEDRHKDQQLDWIDLQEA